MTSTFGGADGLEKMPAGTTSMTNAFGGAKGWEPVDAGWMILCTFIVFTMQPGFALQEAGMVGIKNGANVFVRNILVIVIGGLSFWFFGYAFSFGSNSDNKIPSISGSSYYLAIFNHTDGYYYAHYVFELSFAVKANSIVSGAVSERISLSVYMIFAFLNTGLIYVFPAHWVWNRDGWLKQLGALDFAGSSVVHMSGGIAALVAAKILGPRNERFGNKCNEYKMSNPIFILLGTLLLTLGWFGFNCGSTLALSREKWITASKVAVVTVNGAISGGLSAVLLGFALKWNRSRRYLLDIPQFAAGILGGLVAITAGANVFRPWQGMIVGFIGGIMANIAIPVLEKFKVDDPVGAFPVHYAAGIWGMIAVGFFSDGDDSNSQKIGIIEGGHGHLLGYNLLACLVITVWSGGLTAIIFLVLKLITNIRLEQTEENKGSDYTEHGITIISVNNENVGLLKKSYGSSLNKSRLVL